MKLPPAWYAVELSSEVKNKPCGLRRFGQNLVFFRDSKQKIVVLEDKCPHRSAKLSAGSIIDDTIECPFHGFRYNTEGMCVYAPELQRSLPKLCTKVFTSYESDGIIWLWYGSNSPLAQPTWFKETESKIVSGFRELWPCHFSRCVENQLDYTHLPFVHRNSIGRFARVGQRPEISYSEDSIHFSFSQQNSGQQFIKFKYPNYWINSINNKFVITLIFVPISEQETELILSSYQSYISWPIISRIFGWIANILNKRILREDQRVVLTQNPANSLLAQDEKLMSNDVLIKHFRQWLSDPAN
jgi:phenylpropionate dioxygenase-like ring-hydroxylating dioxygenase large terminal subunit